MLAYQNEDDDDCGWRGDDFGWELEARAKRATGTLARFYRACASRRRSGFYSARHTLGANRAEITVDQLRAGWKNGPLVADTREYPWVAYSR